MYVTDMGASSLFEKWAQESKWEKKESETRKEEDSISERFWGYLCEQWGLDPGNLWEVSGMLSSIMHMRYVRSEYFSICSNPSVLVGVLGD